MKKESCGHSLKAASYISLKSYTAKTTHMPHVAAITGTWGIEWWRRLATTAILTEYLLASTAIFHVLRMEWQEGHTEDWHPLTHTGRTALARRDELVPPEAGGGDSMLVCLPVQHRVWDTSQLLWLKAAPAQIAPVLLLHRWNEVLSRRSSGALCPSTQMRL